MAKKTQTGTPAVRAQFLDAQRRLDEAKAIDDPDPSEPRTIDGHIIRPGRWDGAPWNRMPPGCPVTVLGSNGETVWVVSATGNLHGVEKWDHPTLMRLFAPYPNYALWAWPAFGKSEGKDEDGNPLPPPVKRLERDRCVTALIAEAGRRGLFDPEEHARGRGGWKTADGRMLWHSGRALWQVEAKSGQLQAARPGEVGEHYYPQAIGILEPWMTAIEPNDSPAHALWQILTSWQWERPWLDPVLYLGWIAAAMMGAALDERPIIFVTGGPGTGKSTLHDITKAVFGPMLFSTANTTAAGIYQNIRQDSRPVMVDEFEAEAKGDKKQGILEIARVAYSGQNLDRGGQNHEGVSFTLRNAFGFSAIIPPPLNVQDRSRIVMLKLKPLTGDSPEPVIEADWGRMLLRQVLDGFPRYEHELLPRWKQWLAKGGFSRRMMDTYGTLLAAAELLIGEIGLISAGFHSELGNGKLDEDMVTAAIVASTRTELADQEEKWQTVMSRLLPAQIENWKAGERPTVAEVLEQYEAGLTNRGNGLDLAEARRRLANIGLGLKPAGDATPGYALAIPKSHPALEKIFADTEFRGGNWYTALKQAPGQIAPRGLGDSAYTIKISMVAKYCVLVDMAAYQAAMERE